MQFSVPMALFDFVPVILYLVSSVIFQRDFYSRMSKDATQSTVQAPSSLRSEVFSKRHTNCSMHLESAISRC